MEQPGKYTRTMHSQRLKIICEGHTEKRYLSEFACWLGILDLVEIVISEHSNPATVLRELMDADAKDAKEIWLVFDRDCHADFKFVERNAGKLPNVHVVISNPCLEYWFLLHFEAFDDRLPLDAEVVVERRTHWENPTPTSYRRVIEEDVEFVTSANLCIDELLNFFPEYKKMRVPLLRYLAQGTALAYRRARTLPSSGGRHASAVPDLIDRLCLLAGAGTEEILEELETRPESAVQCSDRVLSASEPWLDASQEEPFAESLQVLAKVTQAIEALPSPAQIVTLTLPADLRERIKFCKEWLEPKVADASPRRQERNKRSALFRYLRQMAKIFAAGGTRPKKSALLELLKAVKKLESTLEAAGVFTGWRKALHLDQ